MKGDRQQQEQQETTMRDPTDPHEGWSPRSMAASYLSIPQERRPRRSREEKRQFRTSIVDEALALVDGNAEQEWAEPVQQSVSNASAVTCGGMCSEEGASQHEVNKKQRIDQHPRGGDDEVSPPFEKDQ
jgi:hypothetical protein